MIEGFKLPDVTFKTRVRDDSIDGFNPFRWEDKTTADYFAGKRVVLFSLPEHSHQLVQHISCPVSRAMLTKSKNLVLMKSIVCQ